MPTAEFIVLLVLMITLNLVIVGFGRRYIRSQSEKTYKLTSSYIDSLVNAFGMGRQQTSEERLAEALERKRRVDLDVQIARQRIEDEKVEEAVKESQSYDYEHKGE